MPAPERIAIVGLGLIGGSLALALRRSRPELRIVGVDEDARTRELALRGRAVDAAVELAHAPLEICDAVVLAVPARALLEMILPISARMRRGAPLTDVCGAKERICAAGATQDNAVFVGGHLKNAAAPLHPPVVTAVDTSGSMYVGPAVQPTDEPPMVFSSVS